MGQRFRWVTRPFFAPVSKDRWVTSRGGSFLWKGEQIWIPEGWRTDLTSSPRMFQWLVPRDGSHAYAAAVHDTALEAGWERGEARAAMVEALCVDRYTVSWWRRVAMIAGVWVYDKWHGERGAE